MNRNQALSDKWLWRFPSECNSLWATATCSKFGHGSMLYTSIPCQTGVLGKVPKLYLYYFLWQTLGRTWWQDPILDWSLGVCAVPFFYFLWIVNLYSLKEGTISCFFLHLQFGIFKFLGSSGPGNCWVSFPYLSYWRHPTIPLLFGFSAMYPLLRWPILCLFLLLGSFSSFLSVSFPP